METVGGPTYVALASSLFFISAILICIRTPWYAIIRQGLYCAPHYGNKSEHFYIIFWHPEFSIICIGSESCLWSIVGLPGSCAYYLTFCYIG